MRSYGAEHPHCWTNSFPDEFLHEQIRFCIDLSIRYEADCRRLGIPFFDTSEDFVTVHGRAKDHVLDRLANKAIDSD
jgi:hypothetical protein